MKTLFQTSTLFAALFCATALPAGNFQVPFEFEASGKTLPAGRYMITPAANGTHIVRLMNLDSGKSIMVSLPTPEVDPNLRAPRIVFACEQENCKLKEVWQTPGLGALRVTK